MEDVFLLPKAKAPVIFKVKTASALEFHSKRLIVGTVIKSAARLSGTV